MGALSAEMEVWRAQMRDPLRPGHAPELLQRLPQRNQWALPRTPADGAAERLCFTFRVDQVPTRPFDLLVEGRRAVRDHPERLGGRQSRRRLVSGSQLSSRVAAGPASRPQHAGAGLPATTNHCRVEDCFLIGDFVVSTERAIIAEPARLHLGDWTSQGYLHYAGSMIYHGCFDPRPAARGGACGCILAVRGREPGRVENGTLVGHIPWQDATGLDLTAFLAKGINNVTWRWSPSPRNMLVPRSTWAPGREPWTDWRSFRPQPTRPTTPIMSSRAWGLIGQCREQYEDYVSAGPGCACQRQRTPAALSAPDGAALEEGHVAHPFGHAPRQIVLG